MKYRKIACIYTPHIFEEIEKTIKKDTRPIIVVSGKSEKDIIIDFDPGLEKYGVLKGNYLKSLGVLKDNVNLCTVNYDYIDKIIQNILSFLGNFSPIVEPDSYYKYYIDLTGTYHLFGRYIDAVENIIVALKKKFSLTAKAGIGKNILIASSASIIAGNMSVYEVAPHSEMLFIRQLPLSIIPLFPNSIKKVLVSDYNLTKVNDISKLSKDELLPIAKEHSKTLYNLSRGVARESLLPKSHQKGIKVEIIPTPGSDDNAIRKRLSNALFELSLKLYNQKINPSSIQITVSYQDNYQFRSHVKLDLQYIHGNSIYKRILPYLNKALKRRIGVKVIDIKLIDFRQIVEQLSLFPEVSESNNLYKSLISIKKKFGKKYINYGA